MPFLPPTSLTSSLASSMASSMTPSMTPSIAPSIAPSMTPSMTRMTSVMPPVITPATADREAARKEARAKAQAKADGDLGLSPPVYIDNLKDKLRRKASEEDEARIRTRSFSEPQSADLITSGIPAIPVAPVEYPHPAALMKSAKSVPQMMNFTPDGFLQNNTQSPPLSPSSVTSGSSNSTSYLWAGLSPAALSPAQSQLKLTGESGASGAAGLPPSSPPVRNYIHSYIHTFKSILSIFFIWRFI